MESAAPGLRDTESHAALIALLWPMAQTEVAMAMANKTGTRTSFRRRPASADPFGGQGGERWWNRIASIPAARLE